MTDTAHFVLDPLLLKDLIALQHKRQHPWKPEIYSITLSYPTKTPNS